MIVPASVIVSAPVMRAMPKSPSFGRPSSSNSTLAGLTSR